MLATRSAAICAALWLTSIVWIVAGQGSAHPDAHRLILASALGATIIAAADRHARQLSEVAALSYRAGAAARDRESRLIAGELPAEPRGAVR
jgi:hypothetical protein